MLVGLPGWCQGSQKMPENASLLKSMFLKLNCKSKACSQVKHCTGDHTAHKLRPQTGSPIILFTGSVAKPEVRLYCSQAPSPNRKTERYLAAPGSKSYSSTWDTVLYLKKLQMRLLALETQESVEILFLLCPCLRHRFAAMLPLICSRLDVKLNDFGVVTLVLPGLLLFGSIVYSSMNHISPFITRLAARGFQRWKEFYAWQRVSEVVALI